MQPLALELKQTMQLLKKEKPKVEALAERFPELTVKRALEMVLTGKAISLMGGIAAIFPRKKYRRGNTHLVEFRPELGKNAIAAPLHTHFSGREDGVELIERWVVFSPGVVTFYVEDAEGEVVVDFEQNSKGCWFKTKVTDDPEREMRLRKTDGTMRLRMREEVLGQDAHIMLNSCQRRAIEVRTEEGSVLEMTLWTEKPEGGGDSWLDRDSSKFSY